MWWWGQGEKAMSKGVQYNKQWVFTFSGLVPKSIYDDAIENRGSGGGFYFIKHILHTTFRDWR